MRAFACLVLLAACGGDDVVSADPDAEVTSGTIGPDGGTVTADGLTLTIPPGALDDEVAITVTRTEDPAPAGYEAQSAVYEFLPTGTTFDVDVTVAIDVTGDTTGSALQWTSDGETWIAIAGAEADGVFTAAIDHFSGGFVGRVITTPAPTGLVTWDPSYAPNGAEVYGLVDTGAGLYQLGNYAEVFAIDAPAEGTPLTVTLAHQPSSDPQVIFRGPAPLGAGFVAGGMVTGGVLAASTFGADGHLTRAITVSEAGEGKGATALDDGSVAIVGSGSVAAHTTGVKVLFLDAGLTNVTAGVYLESSYGRAIAPGAGGGVVAISSAGVFRIAATGAVTWQRGIAGGTLVDVVRLGTSYAVLGNFTGVPHVLLLDDAGAVTWQRSLSSAVGAPVARGLDVITVDGAPHLWVGGTDGASAMEWILSSAGALRASGRYGAGIATAAIGQGDDLVVAGVVPASPFPMWTARHALAYDVGACTGAAATETATASSLAVTTTAVFTQALTGITVAAPSLTAPPQVDPVVTDACP